MAATAGPRKTISIYDYPEHLNPFREDDHHNRIRFWTIGRKLNRSNSISFSGIKDLKNSWAFRSFMKKGKKGQTSSAPQPAPAQQQYKPSQTNGESDSPIMFRRALQYSSMSEKRGHMSTPERYVYGGSITPLPRSRFQERLRSTSQYDVDSMSTTPRMARSEVSGSRLSVESTNPFEEPLPPVPPVRMSRRKKKKAPPPPPQRALDVSVTSIASEIIEEDTSTSNAPQTTANDTADDIDIEMAKLNIELKIIEDEDLNQKLEANNNDVPVTKMKSPDRTPPNTPQNEISEIEISKTKEDDNTLDVTNGNSEENILDKVSFPKVNIERYRRNSSVNEDDIRLRRGNLEDFHALTYKRSKSLTNTLDTTHVIYDIHLNEDLPPPDLNGNGEPLKLICKVYEDVGRKQSVDTSISRTEREFNEIDEATRQLQQEISKLNSALKDDDVVIRNGNHKENGDAPNPIPKPRRSHFGNKASILKN